MKSFQLIFTEPDSFCMLLNFVEVFLPFLACKDKLGYYETTVVVKQLLQQLLLLLQYHMLQ